MLKFQTSFSLQSLYLCFVFTATNYRNSKICNNGIVKLFLKKRLGRGVKLSLMTRNLKRTHLASLSGSCSQFEMLQMLTHLMLGKVSSYITLTFFPTIKVHVFANKNDELTFWWFEPGYLNARVTFFFILNICGDVRCVNFDRR